MLSSLREVAAFLHSNLWHYMQSRERVALQAFHTSHQHNLTLIYIQTVSIRTLDKIERCTYNG